MTLSEGISHLEQVLQDPNHFSCEECRQEHVQLWRWLLELEQYRMALRSAESIHGEISRRTPPGEVPQF